MRSTHALVNLEHLEHNARLLRALHSKQRTMWVLKGNAYGHGMRTVAQFLQQCLAPAGSAAEAAGDAASAQLFAVALLDEALALRRWGIQGRVLVLGAPEAGRWDEALQAQIELSIPTLEALDALATHLKAHPPAAGAFLNLHLKVDSGMHRIGIVLPPTEAMHAALHTCGEAVRVRGVYSHLASSENLDDPFSEAQYATFMRWCEVFLRRHEGETPELHLANSAGLLRDPRFHLAYARCGYALWAPLPFTPPHRAPPANAELRPVMSLRSQVSQVKCMPQAGTVGYGRSYQAKKGEWIATLPVGYADGYRSAMSPQAQVLIGERRAPLVGRVSMDQINVSLGQLTQPLACAAEETRRTQTKPVSCVREAPVETTAEPPCAVGAEAVLWGDQGDEQIPIEEAAQWGGTRGYELLVCVSARVPRVYLYRGMPYASRER